MRCVVDMGVVSVIQFVRLAYLLLAYHNGIEKHIGVVC